MQIAIPIYDGVTALDAIGPYEPLSRVPGTDVRFVGVEAGPVRCDTDALSLVADYAVDDVPSPEVIVVPGGGGSRNENGDALLDWIRVAHETTKWTTSVCTGSLLLGKAGILDGLKATSHWIYLDMLREYGAEPTLDRVVEQGKVVTAAGVSSGIDMALRLIQLEAGDDLAQAIQLSVEYDPQPPVDAGSPQKAPDHIVDLVRKVEQSQAGSG
ncbi:MAG: glutamine amidotransferase [Chloroflexota bacterium]|jgi:putative intracellular protease/amidase|nr:glutamine amidotransferase [Chloroflexota bacterium]